MADPDEQYFDEGVNFSKLERYADSVSSFDKALAINPSFADAWFSRGFALGVIGRNADAVDSFDRGLALCSDDAHAWFFRGHALGELGRFTEAITSYDNSISINPMYAWAWNNRGDAQHNLGMHAEAVVSYNHALSINPDFADAWFHRGLALLMGFQQHAEVVDSYDRGLAINPDNSEAWRFRGVALAALGRYLDAVASSDKAIALNPGDDVAWNTRGYALGELGRYSEAITSFDRSLAINPDSTNTRKYRDIALHQQEKNPNTKKPEPNLPDKEWFEKGNALKSVGKYQESIECYNKALEINPRNAEVWGNKGNTLGQLGKPLEAINCFDKVLEINSVYDQAWFNKGVSYGILENYPESIKCYNKALEINPKNTGAWLLKGNALEKLGKFSEAIKSYETFIEFAPPESAPDVEKTKQIVNHLKSRKSANAESKSKTDFIHNSPILWGIGYKIQNLYDIIDIKKGGMGVVYIAHNLSEIFAFKTFQDKFLWNEDVIQRFMAEAETWTKLERHTNIVFAHIVQRFEGKPLLFLEYIDGGNLEQFIGKLTIEQSLDFAIQFCTGMEYAYQKLGVIHRDIKPSNVMVQKDPRFRFGYAFKITDFGLVKVLGNEFLDESVNVSMGMGTLPFMPPEQFPERIQEKFHFRGPVTTKSDIYSFGITLYELLTGKLPFDDMNEIFTKYPVRPKHLNPMIPECLDILIIKCLEKNPDKRYTDFTELKEKLVELYNDFTGESYAIVGKKEPLTAIDWCNKGTALANLGKYEDGIKCFDNALASNPKDAITWNNKGETLKDLGKYKEAIGCYDKAIEINPRYFEAWNNKGVALKNLGKPMEAIECYDKALEINPRFEMWNNKGVALKHLRKPLEAIKCFDKSLEINPRDYFAWGNKGNALGELGKYQEAIACYSKSLEINPREAFGWSNKAIALEKLGKYQEAIRCYEKCLELAPPQATSLVEQAKQSINQLRG